jgi:hypothetical protein
MNNRQSRRGNDATEVTTFFLKQIITILKYLGPVYSPSITLFER